MIVMLRDKRGFTLLEILTVLALTIIIMGLVFYPVAKSFSMTRQAEVMVRAQDDARQALSLLSRDLANAMYVYDNTRDAINFPVVNRVGDPVVVPVMYAKVDMVLPRMRGYCPHDPSHTPGGVPRGDEAAPVCPVCARVLELKPVEPLAPDTKIVRYFVGLQDPTQPYANGFVNKLTTVSTDNTYVLYRAEFDVWSNRLFPEAMSVSERLSDPNFFYRSELNANGETYAQAWKSISRPIVSIANTDLIKLDFDADGSPLVTPTVRFTPTAIYNDPMVPTTDSDDNPEYADTPPTVYKASYGHWVLPYEVTIEPEDTPDFYFRTMPGLGGSQSPDPPTDMCVYRIAHSGSGGSKLIFNISHYERTRENSPLGVGEIVPKAVDGPQRAFLVDTVRGTVDFAFPVCDSSASNENNMVLSRVLDSDGVNTIIEGMRRVLVNDTVDRILNGSLLVPGSVRVIAPGAQPDESFGKPVLYTRVPFLLYDPGPNQFSVDPYYDEQKGVASVNFHTLQTVSGNPGIPLPSGKVMLYYEVQNNRKGDRIRASYCTKSLMTVIMGIRIYNPIGGRPESVELTNKVKLRNVRT